MFCIIYMLYYLNCGNYYYLYYFIAVILYIWSKITDFLTLILIKSINDYSCKLFTIHMSINSPHIHSGMHLQIEMLPTYYPPSDARGRHAVSCTAHCTPLTETCIVIRRHRRRYYS